MLSMPTAICTVDKASLRCDCCCCTAAVAVESDRFDDDVVGI